MKQIDNQFEAGVAWPADGSFGGRLGAGLQGGVPVAVEIPLDAANRAIAAVRREAERIDVGMSIAVVDDGGNLKAFARMDAAELAGVELAKDKAYTALANSAATHELAEQAAPGRPLFGLHALVGGRYVIFGGGIPLRREGRIVGAIGVSGGLVEQDVACAQAGVAEWERSGQAEPMRS